MRPLADSKQWVCWWERSGMCSGGLSTTGGRVGRGLNYTGTCRCFVRRSFGGAFPRSQARECLRQPTNDDYLTTLSTITCQTTDQTSASEQSNSHCVLVGGGPGQHELRIHLFLFSHNTPIEYTQPPHHERRRRYQPLRRGRHRRSLLPPHRHPRHKPSRLEPHLIQPTSTQSASKSTGLLERPPGNQSRQ